jgi:hypothetical protein
MSIKLALFLVVATSLAVVPQAIADDSVIMKTLRGDHGGSEE